MGGGTVLCQVLAVGATLHPLFPKNKLEKTKNQRIPFSIIPYFLRGGLAGLILISC